MKLQHLFPGWIIRFSLALIGVFFALNSAYAQSGTWINTAGGSWASSANWSGGVIATNTDSTADFSTLTLTATNTVTLDGARTVGNLIFGDQGNSYGWKLAPGSGGPLTLAVSSGTPVITVNNQTATIGRSNLLASTGGLIKNGLGTLAFVNGQAFSGGMTVSQGAVSFIYSNSVNSVGMGIGTGAITLNDGNTGANAVSLLLSTPAGSSLRPNVTNAIIVANNGSGETIIGSDNTAIVFAQFSGLLTLNKNVTLQAGNNNGDRTSFNGQITGTGDLYISVLNPGNAANRVSIQHPNATAANDFNGNIILDPNATLQLIASGNFANKVIPDGSSISFNTGSILRLSPTDNDFETVGTLISLTGDAGRIFQDTASKTLTLTIGADGRSGTYGGTIENTAGTLAITKVGSGAQIFSGVNSYSGATIVSNGTLTVNSWLSSSTVTVKSGATLSGVGTLNGSVVVEAGGILLPGTTNLNDGFTMNSSLTLSGITKFNISKEGGATAQNQISGLASVVYGGTLVVTNITSDPITYPLADGDTFYLFSAGSYGAQYFSAYQLPALPNGLTWDTSGLLTGGYIKVTSSAATPIFNPASGGYASPQSITISSDPGSIIFYTTDGSTPTTSSPSGISPVVVALPANTNSFTINAFATNSGYSDSAMASATYSTTPVPTWEAPYNSSWVSSGNWSNNVIANASGVMADFSTLTLSADTAITLDSTPAVGKLKLADAGGLYNWIINPGSGGSLRLDSGATVPAVEVDNMNTTIGAVITGTNGLAKTGLGTLTLTNANTYTGNTLASGGVFKLDTSALSSTTPALASGVINNSATVLFYRGNVGYTPVNSKLSGAGDYYVDGLGGGNNDYRFIFKGTNSDNTGTIHVTNNGNMWLDPTAGVGGQAQSTALGSSCIVEVGPSAKFFIHYSTISQTIGGLNGSGLVSANNSPGQPILSPLLIVGGGNQSASFSGVMQDGTGQLSFAKTGSGTQILSGTNTFTGATIVSNGTLVVNGSIAASANPLAVQPGGTLSGIGTIGRAIIVDGTLAPGTNNTGVLTCSGNLTLNADSTSTFAVNGSTLINNSAALGGTATYGGTLNILPAGTFSAGQSFVLFSGAGAASASSFASISGSPGAGLGFNFTNGVLSVVTTAVAPVSLTNSISGNTLTLTWPAGQGWRLVGQTNSLSTGLNPNPAAWGNVSGANDGSAIITINPTNPAAFYRLVNP